MAISRPLLFVLVGALVLLVEVAAAVKALTSIIEPVTIVLVGVIAGFIVISMYMPMFKV